MKLPHVQELENQLFQFRQMLLRKRKEMDWKPSFGLSHNMTVNRFSKTKRKTLRALGRGY